MIVTHDCFDSKSGSRSMACFFLNPKHRRSSVIIVWVLYHSISDSLLATVTPRVDFAYTASDLVPRLRLPYCYVVLS